MLKVTKSEWARKHRDYKSRRGDRTHPSLLVLNPVTGATELWPVEIVPDSDPIADTPIEDRIEAEAGEGPQYDQFWQFRPEYVASHGGEEAGAAHLNAAAYEFDV